MTGISIVQRDALSLVPCARMKLDEEQVLAGGEEGGKGGGVKTLISTFEVIAVQPTGNIIINKWDHHYH